LVKVKCAGYAGVEMSIDTDVQKRDRKVELIHRHRLSLIAQHWETNDYDFSTHQQNYVKRLRNLAATNPLFINSQTGKDYYSFEKNKILLELADEISINTGVPILHETHRGKFSYAAHVLPAYLTANPKLEICLDISHWCCVAETLLEDQEDAVSSAIKHTRHIHSRVGHQEGPQIMDPRAVEHMDMVKKHLYWWQLVANHHKKIGKNTMTVTTEFGPPPYLQLLPHTKKPIYDQWEVNLFMMNLLRENIV